MKEEAVVFLMLQASRTRRVWGCAVGCGTEEGGGSDSPIRLSFPHRHCHTFPIHRGQRGQGVVDVGAGCSVVRQDLAMSRVTADTHVSSGS